MPKTAVTILAFISNPTTKREDIQTLCQQIHMVYDGNTKVSTIVADAAMAIYKACGEESNAREVYVRIEEIAYLNKIKLEEPLFIDMVAYKNDPQDSQKQRNIYRNQVLNPA